MSDGPTAVLWVAAVVLLAILVIAGMHRAGMDTEVIQLQKPAKLEQRFTVKSYGKFEAGERSAEREVCVLTDTATGVEYLAVTGAGVTALVGKVTVVQGDSC